VGAFAWYSLTRGELSVFFWLAAVVLGVWLILWEAKWLALPLMATPHPLSVPAGLRVAAVTTFVPSGEPLAMLETTLEALVHMRIPHETWVLDEEGTPRVRALCARLGARYFCRAEFPRYGSAEGAFAPRTKHGNYDVWLEEIGFDCYDIVAAFDPDHMPRPDYLERLLGYFRDPAIGYVQSAPGYYNQSASFVARAAAEEICQHAASVLKASYGAGYAPLVGSHNVHRVAALRQIGGFPAHDAEDVLMAALYPLHGWQGVYVPERLALGLAPAEWGAYLRQQRRWARAHVDLKLRVLPTVFSGVPWRQQLGAYLHGLHFLTSALIPIGLGLVATWLAVGRAPVPLSEGWPFFAAPIAAIALAELFRQRFAIESHQRGLIWRGAVVRIAKWPYVLLGILDNLRRSRPPYDLTRKAGRGPSEWLLPGVTVTAVALIVSAWTYGAAAGGIEDPGLHALGATVLAPLLVVLGLSRERLPHGFDAALAEQALERLRHDGKPRTPAGGSA